MNLNKKLCRVRNRDEISQGFDTQLKLMQGATTARHTFLTLNKTYYERNILYGLCAKWR